ncbi:hypothetical protein SD70_05025 [Gordoniibacillus kamchatkensis]|uniref:2-dehydropantoate 2-reductase n=1 Tax=Gordoniibacillus kamchatkensis TaxID=1590651 RepID=A0ABR5AL86_9BACL|nr:2-dehydropantoate 2-reductase [Paenibacillus sp. VKM B-2647]KIL41735.1 hypothetical protein SD70_05025 [Paenibacillus sp. VKM B-2647]
MQRLRIIGGGSIGLLLAGKLAAAGEAQVELVTRSEEQAETIRREGVTVREPGGSFRAQVAARSFAETLTLTNAGERPDWVLLTVKQQAIDSALLSGLQAAAPVHGIVCWQNGIGHIDTIAAAAPDAKLLIAVTTEGARRLSPSEVDHTGAGLTEIGDASRSDEPQQRFELLQKKLVQPLANAGFDASVSKHIHTSVWNKLLINAVINPLTAIWRVPNGLLLQSAAAQALIRSLTDEAVAVAAAEGAEISAQIAERIAGVCRRTAANRSSMLQDIEAGRMTENEWISGAIVRIAAKHGVHVPVTETVYRIVQQLERGW